MTHYPRAAGIEVISRAGHRAVDQPRCHQAFRFGFCLRSCLRQSGARLFAYGAKQPTDQISMRQASAGVTDTGSWGAGVELNQLAVAVIGSRVKHVLAYVAPPARRKWLSDQAGRRPQRVHRDHRPPLFSPDASETALLFNAPPRAGRYLWLLSWRRECSHHTVAHDAQEDAPRFRRRKGRIGMPTLQRSELPAVMPVSERLLERVCVALVVSHRGGARIARTAIQDYSIDVPLVAHEFRKPAALQPESTLVADEIE